MKLNEKVIIKNENKWIAINADGTKVFASATKLDILEKKLERMKIKNIVIRFVPPFDTVLSPTCL